MGAAESARAHVFLLQGPVGPFFGALAGALTRAGYRALNVAFNVPDRLRGGAPHYWFRRDQREWEQTFTALCRLHRPRCIILFGDRRPLHAVACAVAERLGIRIFSFEEGYLRPDFVTFEEHGNNARSRVFDDPSMFARTRPAVPARPVGKTLTSMARQATGYFILMRLCARLTPDYRHHRERPLTRELLLWGRCFTRALANRRADSKRVKHLKRAFDDRYYIVALQVHDDLQATCHSRGFSQERLIESAIRSFARHAPQGTRLVLRYHPLDRGHRSYGPMVARLAAAHGVEDRVEVMYSGHGPTLLSGAAGFITVNSTMALSALRHACPVFAFGDVFFRLRGLIADGCEEADLDRFWTNPGVVDTELFERAAAHLRAATQINGSFYARRFHAHMADAVIARLRAEGITPAIVSVPTSWPTVGASSPVALRGHAAIRQVFGPR
jgi:capsular polysaccharide export protein